MPSTDKRSGLLDLTRRHGHRSPDAGSTGTCSSETCLSPFDNQRPLELSKRPEHRQHEPSTGRGRVDSLGQRAQMNPPARQRLYEFQQVLERPGQTVEPPHDQGVAWPQVSKTLVEFRARGHRAADPLIHERLLHASRVERVELEARALLDSAHPRISD